MGIAQGKRLGMAEMTELVASEIACRLGDGPHAEVELWHIHARVETVLHDGDGSPLYRWRVFSRMDRAGGLHGTVRGDVGEACRSAAQALASVVTGRRGETRDN